jgi:hypothetical protein
MVVVGNSVYKAITQKNLPSQNTISGLLPYYSTPVEIKTASNVGKIELQFIDEIDLRFESLNKNSNYSLEFSQDSKQLLVKKYDLDANFNRQSSQIAQIDVSNRSTLNFFSEKNQDILFDKNGKLLSLTKTFYSDNLNKGLVLSREGEDLWSFQSEQTNRGSVWQVYNSPLYLTKRNWLAIHLYNPIDILGKHQIKIFNLDTNTEIHNFEVKPFKDLKSNKNEDYIFATDPLRFDGDFIDVVTGKIMNIDNRSYILSSILIDSDQQFRFITSSTKDLQIKNSGRYIPFGETVRNLKIWDISDGSLVGVIETFDEDLSEIESTNDNRFLITASLEEKIRFIDLTEKTEVLALIPQQKIDPKNNAPAFKIALSPDQKTLVGIGQDGKLRFWQVRY